MATPGLDADDLAAAGHADALLGRLVALDLRHAGLTFLSGLPDWPPRFSPARAPTVPCSLVRASAPWSALAPPELFSLQVPVRSRPAVPESPVAPTRALTPLPPVAALPPRAGPSGLPVPSR